MIDRELDIQTADGAMNTFVTHPEEGGPHPVVLFYMDAPGKRSELHDMARRLGTAGYFVVLPNLYYRRVRDFRMGTGDDARRIMFEHMNSLDRTKVLTDTAAMLKFVAGEPAARSDKIGVVGYCMSGPFVLWAAAEYPDRVAAAASFHGVNLCTDAPESPHRFAADIKGRAVHRLRSDRRLGPAGNAPGAGCASADHAGPLSHRDVPRDGARLRVSQA